MFQILFGDPNEKKISRYRNLVTLINKKEPEIQKLDDKDLQSKTLPELKEICKQNKLKLSGKKDELIDRIIGIQDL